MAQTSHRMGRRGSRGVGLFEVLVAITIASIGLLTIAGVHVRLLRQAKMSQYRALATMAATDLAERMRANPQADYQLRLKWSDQAAFVKPAKPCIAWGDNCSPAELAQADLHHWRGRLRDLLPEGRAFVVEANALGARDLWVAWLDPVVKNVDEVAVSSTAAAKECHNDLQKPDGARCLYVRVRL